MKTNARFPGVIRLIALMVVCPTGLFGEIVFQDFFTSLAGNLTNSTPWIDVQGNGWQTGSAASQLVLDGSGHVYNAAAGAGTAAGVPLIPIGPHGSFTVSAQL